VRLNAIERTGELLDLLVQAGATSVSGVRFDLKDRAGAEREALRLAVIDAPMRSPRAPDAPSIASSGSTTRARSRSSCQCVRSSPLRRRPM
jgi:uncharacterized protein YggE